MLKIIPLCTKPAIMTSVLIDTSQNLATSLPKLKLPKNTIAYSYLPTLRRYLIHPLKGSYPAFVGIYWTGSGFVGTIGFGNHQKS